MLDDRDKYRYYDLYEDERPYHWIGITVWGVIIFYLFSVFALGVFTTPVQDGRPVLADSEMRKTTRYINRMWTYIEESQELDFEARRILALFAESGVTRSSVASQEIWNVLLRLMTLTESVEKLTPPARFGGVVVLRNSEELVNDRAFHPMVIRVFEIQLELVTEMYQYLSDFDESRIVRIHELQMQYNRLAEEAFGLFVLLIGDQASGG